MSKIIIAGLISVCFFAGSTYAISELGLFTQKERSASADGLAKSEIRKSTTINIPIVIGVEVSGYLVIQLAFRVESLEPLPKDGLLEAYVVDEAISLLYSEANKSTKAIEKVEVAGMMPRLLKMVQSRSKESPVKELFLQEFTFIPRADVR